MKQGYAFIFFWLSYCGLCAPSASAQVRQETKYPIQIAVYVFDSCSIELNHTLFAANGSILCEQQADAIPSFGNVLFGHENLSIDYNHGKWRMDYHPVFIGDPDEERKRHKGSANFLNKFDENNSFFYGHDDIVLRLYMKDTTWVDTLPKSKEIAIVIFGTDASSKLVQLLDTVNVLVVKREYARALECMKPLMECCISDQDYRFMTYYHRWIVAQQQETRNTAVAKSNKGRRFKTR